MRVLKLFSIFIFLLYGNAIAQGNKITKSSQDTSFTSDNLEVNEQTNIMTATGNVIIVSDGRKITANKVTYDQDADKAIAIGNVVLDGVSSSSEDHHYFITGNELWTNVKNDNIVLENKQLIKTVDVLGRNTKEKNNTPLFYIYNDGSVEKRIIKK